MAWSSSFQVLKWVLTRVARRSRPSFCRRRWAVALNRAEAPRGGNLGAGSKVSKCYPLLHYHKISNINVLQPDPYLWVKFQPDSLCSHPSPPRKISFACSPSLSRQTLSPICPTRSWLTGKNHVGSHPFALAKIRGALVNRHHLRNVVRCPSKFVFRLNVPSSPRWGMRSCVAGFSAPVWPLCSGIS